MFYHIHLRLFFETYVTLVAKWAAQVQWVQQLSSLSQISNRLQPHYFNSRVNTRHKKAFSLQACPVENKKSIIIAFWVWHASNCTLSKEKKTIHLNQPCAQTGWWTTAAHQAYENEVCITQPDASANRTFASMCTCWATLQSLSSARLENDFSFGIKWTGQGCIQP